MSGARCSIAYRIANCGPISDAAKRRLQPVAALHGVTVDRLVDVIRARRRHRRARFFRRRGKKRALKARSKPFSSRLYAGEGALDNLLRQSGLTVSEYCDLCGITVSSFRRWAGHPLTKMPIALLEHFIWAKNMAAFLIERGYDPGRFRPQALPRAPGGHYPRTTDQVQQLIRDVKPKLTRYLVRRASKEVFIWTEILAANYAELEEVYAQTAAEAVGKPAIPSVQHASATNIDEMNLETLVLFASRKLGINLDPSNSLAKLREQVIATVEGRDWSPWKIKR
jgi:hypothetical protein